jgi:hypothetical protein
MTETETETAAREIYRRVADMRWLSRVLIALAAALIRGIVLHWPGLTGGIACGQVWAEIMAANERRETGVSRETAGRAGAPGARPC